MQVVESTGGCLPTGDEPLFLRACCYGGQEAVLAWEQWRRSHPLDVIDEALFRLLPLLYYNLREAGFDSPDMGLLKGVYRRNWYLNQRLFHAVEQLLEQLHSEGIPTLVFKGIALSQLYYADPTVRTMSDGDIMVPISHAEKTIHFMLASGWKLKEPLKRNYFRTSHAGTFIDAEGVEIDLHWHLYSECCGAEDDEVFWQRAVPFTLGSQQTLTLSHTDHVLHACIHGYQWNVLHSLRWVPDAFMAITKSPQDIDWHYMVQQAASRQWLLRLLTPLEVLKHQFGLPVPQEILDDLKKRPVSDFERREHAILIEKGFRDPKRAFLWPLKRTWFRQRRYYPESSLAMRVLTFPAMISNELFLDSLWQLPAALTRLICQKLYYRFLPPPKHVRTE